MSRSTPHRKRLSGLLAAFAIVFAQMVGAAQPAMADGSASLTTMGATYTQNFDTLVSTGTGTLAANTPLGWNFAEVGGAAPTTYTAGTGSSATGDTYSFGAASVAERAFGGLLSGTVAPTIGASFINNTGTAITELAIAYTGEQWRIGNNAAARDDRLDFQYSTDATSLATGTWLDANSLDFINPIKTAAVVGALDGNVAPNRTAISAIIGGLTIANGTSFWIRWTDFNPAGSDDGLAVDDFSLTPQVTVTPTNPSGVGAANPASVVAGGTSLLTVAVTPGTNPTSTGLAVSADLSEIDGAVAQSFFDDGTNGDVTTGDNTFSFNATVSPATTTGAKSLPFTITDAQSRTGSGSIALTVQDAPPAPGGVVISQVYGGGGNVGAQYTHDFIELYNRTASPISLAGWSVQYAGATGTGAWAVTNLSGSIAPGKYYLVQEGAGAGNGVALPVPDAIGSISMSSTAGKVALLSSTTALNGACPVPNLNISDLVGYGATANCSEGSPAPGLSNTTAALRKGNGATDTDNNASDFIAGTPTPRASTDAAPTVVSTSPANGALAIVLNANITINFSEPVNVTASWFTINCATSGAHTATVSGGPSSFTLDPDADFAFNDLCTVTVVAAQVNDQDTDDPQDTMAANFVFSFTSNEFLDCNDPATLISAVQGSAAASPAIGTVVTIDGVVVGDYQGTGQLGGFHVQEQDADADGNPATSEGIFIFSSSIDVAAGDRVRVKGTVTEFGSSGVTLTELASVTGVNVCSSGNSVTPATASLPVASLADWEPFEGMLVTIPQDLTVTEHFTLGRFGEVSLSANGRLYTPTNIVAPGAPAIAQQDLNNRSRIMLDDGNGQQNADPIRYPEPGGLSASNTLRTGYTVHTLTGVLEQRFSVYRVQPVGPISFDAATNPRPAAAPAVNGSLRVVGMNLLNFFNTFGINGCTGGTIGTPTDCRGADDAGEFARQWPKTVAAILALNADVIGVNEIENDGYGPSSAIQFLVDRLNDATAPGTYAFIDVDAATGQVDVLGTDAIKVGMLYKPAKVTPVGQTAALNTVAFVNGGDPAPRSRPSLAQAFQQNSTGARFILNINHLKSKGSACSAPDAGDGQGNCNQVRVNAATALVNWLATDPTGTGETDILLMGDYNAYAKEDPITVIKNAGYTNLIESYLGPNAYSYVFDGQSGYLDHALGSAAIVSQVTGVGDYHINADEPTVLDYNDDFKSPGQIISLYAPDQFRVSDHDPVIVGLNLTAPPTPPVANADSYAVNEDATLTVAAPGVLGNDTDVNNDPLTAALGSGPSHGALTLNLDGSFSYTPAANYNGPDSFTYKANDGTADSNVTTVSITVTPVNDDPAANLDTLTVLEDALATTVNVLANDTDVDNDTLVITSVTQGSKGSVVLSAGAVTYKPNANANGSDSFTYIISDGHGGLATGTVNVTITPVNDNPTAVNDTATTPRNTAVLINVRGNDIDIDGDSLVITAVTKPVNGKATVVNGQVRYGPKAGFTGTDTFTYTISDGHGGTATATVTVTVTK
jgi:uncharacterized protein